ncbi:SAM-dependent methyltransferase [Mesorhizobium sp. M0488]|uniref:SAM-dependent methyltransferase n=1 Tax=unclassified Mesorhizobium TaxID=325217 RepID=UPI0033352DCC
MAPHCERLTVIDVEPQTLSMTRLSMQDFSHIDWECLRELTQLRQGVARPYLPGRRALPLPGIAELGTAIDNLVRVLAPDGHLVFGSPRDSTRRHWGRFASAEPAIATLNPKLSQLLRVRCRGNASSEDYLFVLFRNAA